MTPYLLNMSDDVSLAGCLMYPLQLNERTSIGSDPDNTVVVHGLGVLPWLGETIFHNVKAKRWFGVFFFSMIVRSRVTPVQNLRHLGVWHHNIPDYLVTSWFADWTARFASAFQCTDVFVYLAPFWCSASMPPMPLNWEGRQKKTPVTPRNLCSIVNVDDIKLTLTRPEVAKRHVLINGKTMARESVVLSHHDRICYFGSS